ncbi:hypothetical protein [Blastomonas sp.]|uniref:hypothetical protein n=1 Tax=Blastomonas sp. TaxID=1909299 RepID=UPI002635EBB3|nr:hypothetical protein [Blastomonas sp.]MDM7956543.1 hypothetical protein [Blastomonas sp.]
MRRQILSAQAIEYGLLAALLEVVALGLGVTAAWYVITKMFDFGWQPDWGVVFVSSDCELPISTQTRSLPAPDDDQSKGSARAYFPLRYHTGIISRFASRSARISRKFTNGTGA